MLAGHRHRREKRNGVWGYQDEGEELALPTHAYGFRASPLPLPGGVFCSRFEVECHIQNIGGTSSSGGGIVRRLHYSQTAAKRICGSRLHGGLSSSSNLRSLSYRQRYAVHSRHVRTLQLASSPSCRASRICSQSQAVGHQRAINCEREFVEKSTIFYST